MEKSVPTAATTLAQTHLDRVVMGLDNNSISTLGTGAVSMFVPFSIGVTMGVPTNIRRNDIQSPSSDVSISGWSIGTMETLDSRVSQTKTTIT